MVGIRFDRPVGPCSDTNELEYVSALLQTGPTLREDGTINAEDIAIYLRSRHGIKVSEETVKNSLIQGLCGGDSAGDDGDTIDICEFTCLLMIPYLMKLRKDTIKGSMIFDKFFELLMREVKYLDPAAVVADNQIELTPALLLALLENYGEKEIAPQVIQCMISSLSDDDTAQKAILNKETYLKALTKDTHNYNLEWEERNSLFFEDAKDVLVGQEEKSLKFTKQTVEDADNTELPFELIPPGSYLDSVGDTYYNRYWNIFLWFFVVLSYWAYGYGNLRNLELGCTPNTFGCEVAHGVVNWIWVFLQLSIFGFGTIALSSLGNYDYFPTKTTSKLLFTLKNVLSICVMCIMVIGPFAGNRMDTPFFKTEKKDRQGFKALYYVCLIIGLAIILIQLIRTLQIWVPITIPYFTDDALRNEKGSKLAAKAKISTLVENALAMQYEPEYVTDGQKDLSSLQNAISRMYRDGIASGSKGNSNVAQSLLNYDAMQGVKEETGGLWWTWKRMYTGSLHDEFGIWFYARLIATNISQLFIIVFIFILFVGLTQWVHDLYKALTESEKSDLDFLAETYAENAIDLSYITNDTDSTGSFLSLILDINAGNVTDIGDAVSFYLEESIEGGNVQDLGGNIQEILDGTFQPINQSLIFYIDLYTFLDLGNASQSSNNLTGAMNIIDFHQGNDNYDTVFIDPVNFNTFVNGSVGSLFIGGDGSFATTNGVFFLNETSGEFYYDWDFFQVASFLPNLWELELAMAISGLFGLSATAGLITILLPSYVSTVLKFRSGYISSLKDRQFAPLRKSLDGTTQLFGCAFWGAVFTGLTTMLLVFPVAFLLLWHQTRSYVYILIAQVLGIMLTIFIKTVALTFFRAYCTSAFYRKQPRMMNIVNNILECWYIGLTVGYILSRTVMLLLVAAFYVGRIDTPVLAPGVGYVGSSPLDYLPGTFKKDILQHEAHRHPYIERLGLLFMMKLRHGKSFGTSAGAYWRLLFVMSFMPWMRKYRSQKLDESEEDVEVSRNNSDHSGKAFIEEQTLMHEVNNTKEVELDVLRQQCENLMKDNAELRAKLEMLIQAKE